MGSRSRHIAFFNIPAPGHLAPTLAVVEELVRRGHRVSYPATKEFAEEVASAGATVVPYESTIDVQRDFPPGTDNWLAKVLLGGVREGIATTALFDAHFANDRPDAVVYDGFVRWIGELLGEKWRVPAVRLFPVGCVSQHVTQAAIGEAAHTELLGEMQRYAALNGVDPDVAFHQLRGDPEALKIVFYPRRFGYVDAETDDKFVFVGPCLRTEAPQEAWQPPSSGKPVALVSLGTSFNQQPELFRRCIAAFEGLPWHVVVAVGPRVDPADIGTLPPDVETHTWLPFQSVLAHAALTVCSGGTGTVMQALHAGTPLVVLPQLGAADKLAQQLADFGVARVVGRDETSTAAIRAAVLDIAADPGVQAATRDLQEHIRASGGAVRAADEILAHAGRGVAARP
ncbi:putative UDP-glucosyltransferase YjiC [Streptomyces spiroverticillatus]|uniref:UDP-glucosyltransferase YjiC n=1 Tax=Streptomyces finlayi TaxID=67296 RepID=A0A918X840_9ACTN|nr:macrolide family glycosyltransferase [Streptomyces finlayi]GHA44248.1 putative UDP-glucosyltransferase YjiC [Streptomyces spiroverticillatus]GHD17721.1 putative UDP-glucosyltransferase YjiC [Streptomyces finlayi]